MVWLALEATLEHDAGDGLFLPFLAQLSGQSCSVVDPAGDEHHSQVTAVQNQMTQRTEHDFFSDTDNCSFFKH